MRWGRAALAVALVAVALAACSPTSECLCAAPTVLVGPAAVTPGQQVKVDIGGLWTECCPDRPWPWDDGKPQPMNHPNVTIEDGTGTVYGEASADVADDATATVTIELPDDLPAYVWVVVDDIQIEGYWVD